LQRETEDAMKWGGLVAFFALTFAYTWGMGALYVLFPAKMSAMLGAASFSNPFVVAAVYSPSIAALIVTAFQGRASIADLLSRLFRWRIAWYWYVGPVAAIAAIGLGSQVASASAFGTARPVLDLAALPSLALAGLAAFAWDPGPLGEELGWRGFALPRMVQQWNGLTAALVMGTIWGVWHLPAFFIPGLPQSEAPFWTFLIACVCASIIMTFVVNRARGSVLPSILIHWADNRFGELHYPAALMTVLFFAVVAIGLVAIAGVDLGARRDRRASAPDGVLREVSWKA
jgi:membrane protease YdiL (CAAX protease family)